MKRINIFYWISTILFAALMLVSAIPDMLVTLDATKFMAGILHYPDYPYNRPPGWLDIYAHMVYSAGSFL